ncbi:MAG TPA: BlaI/MecI/CopY family transcriptional regulator [Planctomycetaceae bacterium]|nr:BlaI/MecI/CopY family transcriptional regulator [Planctomycetaceae bacterium]HQZ67985.1 BlaI/MecI/CopY family transcriptional regulator [Planctomycetaceae bacterium]
MAASRGVAVMRELGSSQPTAVELEILRILWDLGPSPVRDIHAKLAEVKSTNYSTTVKMLAVMLTKKLVKRDEDATPHIWRAALTRQRAAKKFLTELIEKVYDGSAMSLVLQALASSKASKDEIEEARRLLDQMEEK